MLQWTSHQSSMTTVGLFCVFLGLFFKTTTAKTSLFPIIAEAKNIIMSTTAKTSLFPIIAEAKNIIMSNQTNVSNGNVTVASDVDVLKDLYFMGLFPIGGDEWKGGKSLLEAVKIGIEHVNNQSVIPGYRLNIIPHDTKCDIGVGIKGLCEQLSNPPTKIAIIGGGCSTVTEAIAHASHQWNLVQVGYSAMSSALSNKEEFPLFARLAVPNTKINPARVRFLQYFGWSRIAIIHQTYKLFSKTTEDLTLKLKAAKINICHSGSFSEDPAVQVRNLKIKDCRIIVGLFYENKAQKVFCEAYKIGLYGPRIVWILNDWYEEGWWKTGNEGSIDCTFEQLSKAVEGYFDIGAINHKFEEIRGTSGWLPGDIGKIYSKAMNNTRMFGDRMAYLGYDTVWAVALALNKTRQRLQDMGSNKRLENFSYSDREMAYLLYSSLLNLSFIGLRGPIKFDSNGDSVGFIEIGRVQGGEKRSFGYYDTFESGNLFWYKNPTIVWKGGVIPRDSRTIRIEFETLSFPLYVFMCILASLGIMLACSFLLFNILLRNVRLVKMSSPRLNNVILVGCILGYCTIFVQDAGAKTTNLECEFHTSLLAMGSTLALGGLFAKTWRVYVIFTNTKLGKKIPSDAQLFGMLGVLVLINFIVLVTWWVVDPRYVEIASITLASKEDSAGDVEVRLAQLSCTSKYHVYFHSTFCAIHILVLLIGCILVYETRNVHYPELNDSKQIGMCIYNVALLSIPALVQIMTVNPRINIRFIIKASLVLLSTTVTQCLIFVPKVMAYRHSQIHSSLSTDNRLHPPSSSAFHLSGTTNTF